MAIATINPATGELLRSFTPLGASEIEAKIAAARRGFEANREMSFAERGDRLRRCADLLDQRKRDLGTLMTTEMGKPIRQSVAEIEKCAWVCRYYADHAQAMLAEEPVRTEASASLVRYEPLGVVLAVMPWNFPFWQVFRFAAPALAAGNAGLLKHASNVPQCALAIETIVRDAGFPHGTFGTFLVEANAVEPIIADPRISAVTLTGSTAAGSHVAAAAGRSIKKTVLELGGSDPFVVLASADLEAAVTTAVAARTINSGQSCIAAKRFIVEEPIANDFERRFVDAMQRLVVGDPMDEKTDVGPLATEAGLRALERQVAELGTAGARVLTGGKRLEQSGFYYAPTVLASVPRDHEVAREELFGPVALLFRARNGDEAIDIANETPFGLGASVWTRDDAEQRRLVAAIEAGAVFVNEMVKSDPRLPFGGIKGSGFGRELGRDGIHEFVNAKTVWIK